MTPRRMLVALSNHLKNRGSIPDDFNFVLQYDPKQDEANDRDPRAFCYTMPDSNVIYSTRALKYLPPRAMCGILLHEIGHIVLDAFGTEKAEVLVDSWCIGIDPEYTYGDVSYVQNGEKRKAKALEKCSEEFLEQLQ